jgi:hypothetical protein
MIKQKKEVRKIRAEISKTRNKKAIEKNQWNKKLTSLENLTKID